MKTLAAAIRAHLPPGYSVSVARMPSGNISVQVAYKSGAYNLTITDPSGPISPENIADGAVKMLADDAA